MSNNTKALNYQTDSLTVINRIADALANGSSFDQAIQDIMHAIQNYTNADMLTFLVADSISGRTRVCGFSKSGGRVSACSN